MTWPSFRLRGPNGTELGFWASLWGWIVSISCCEIAHRHDWDDWPACRRCGISGR